MIINEVSVVSSEHGPEILLELPRQTTIDLTQYHQ